MYEAPEKSGKIKKNRVNQNYCNPCTFFFGNRYKFGCDTIMTAAFPNILLKIALLTFPFIHLMTVTTVLSIKKSSFYIPTILSCNVC